MKLKSRLAILVLQALTIWAALTVSATDQLRIGDPAPKLTDRNWIKGEPINDFQSGNAYLVAFLVVGSRSCGAASAQLSRIDIKYRRKGLIVIGQDCSGDDQKSVANLVKGMGDKMNYRVGLDQRTVELRSQQLKPWLFGEGEMAVQTAFLVDTKGRVAWIGRTTALKDATIDAVLAGSFDLEKAAAESAAIEKHQAELLAAGTALGTALHKKNWNESDVRLTEVENLLPENERDSLAILRVRILFGKREDAKACEVARRISDEFGDYPGFQDLLASEIANEKDIPHSGLVLAEFVAMRANDAVGRKDPEFLDRLSRIEFMLGRKKEAIALERKAVKLSVDQSRRRSFEMSLESYKKGLLPD